MALQKVRVVRRAASQPQQVLGIISIVSVIHLFHISDALDFLRNSIPCRNEQPAAP